MKKFIIALTAALLCVSAPCLRAQDASLLSSFVSQAAGGGDKQLGDLAGLLSDKVKAFGASLGDNDLVKGKLDDMLKSFTGGKDAEALAPAFGLVSAAKLTAPQMDLAKQVGNVASAYVVQKNFASLEGGQSDVATLVGALRDGKITSAVPSLKNIAGNAHLASDPQKQLVSVLTDKYVPGFKKAAGALDSVKKLPGF